MSILKLKLGLFIPELWRKKAVEDAYRPSFFARFIKGMTKKDKKLKSGLKILCKN